MDRDGRGGKGWLTRQFPRPLHRRRNGAGEEITKSAFTHQDLKGRLGGAARRGDLHAQFGGVLLAGLKQSRGADDGGAGQCPRGLSRQAMGRAGGF